MVVLCLALKWVLVFNLVDWVLRIGYQIIISKKVFTMTLDTRQKLLALEYLYGSPARLIDDNDDIIWLDERPLPSDTELEALYQEATLETKRKEVYDKISLKCEEVHSSGMEWDFNGVLDKVQTREIDKLNLLGIAIKARELKDLGVTDPFLTFRAESNNNFMLTPQEAIDMTDAVNIHVQTLYIQAWQVKDQLQSATTIEEIESIEAMIDSM